MKQELLPVVFFCLTFFAFTAEAQFDPDQERSILRQMLSDIEQALNDKQIKPVLDLLEDDAVVIFLNGHVARGPDGVRAYFEDIFSGSQAVLKDYQTRANVGAPARFYNDIAVADGTTEDTFYFIDGSDMTVTIYWSAVLNRSGDGWKVVNLHFSSNLFDNPLMAALQQKMIVLIAAAFFIGSLIVFLLMRRKAARNAARNAAN